MNKETEKIIQDFISDSRRLLKNQLVEEYLFGSYAQNKQTSLSDIDILFIVKKVDYKLRLELSTLSSQYSIERGVVISPVMKELKIWEKNKFYNTQFYKEIKKYGVLL